MKKKMKKKKRKAKIRKNSVIVLIIICFFFLTFVIVNTTYGLFESNKVEIFKSNIAKWNINVNDINVTESANFVIDKITLENNTSVKDGKMAPGTSGYFDILIDGTNTDVSFRYDISFDFSDLAISNLKIISIEEVNFNKLVRTAINTYSNAVTLKDIKNGNKNLIRVHVKWENNDDFNDEDSMIGLDDKYELNIPVNITFTQYLGEEIVEYVE